MSEDIIAGRNSVAEALRSERSINKILVQDGAKGWQYRRDYCCR